MVLRGFAGAAGIFRRPPAGYARDASLPYLKTNELCGTPVRAPKANAIAERFVRTVRAGCLDWLLIPNRRQLERVLRVYVDHYDASGSTARSNFGRPTWTSGETDYPSVRSVAATGLAVSSMSTTGPPHERRHEYWRPSGIG